MVFFEQKRLLVVFLTMSLISDVQALTKEKRYAVISANIKVDKKDFEQAHRDMKTLCGRMRVYGRYLRGNSNGAERKAVPGAMLKDSLIVVASAAVLSGGTWGIIKFGPAMRQKFRDRWSSFVSSKKDAIDKDESSTESDGEELKEKTTEPKEQKSDTEVAAKAIKVLNTGKIQNLMVGSKLINAKKEGNKKVALRFRLDKDEEGKILGNYKRDASLEEVNEWINSLYDNLQKVGFTVEVYARGDFDFYQYVPTEENKWPSAQDIFDSEDEE